MQKRDAGSVRPIFRVFATVLAAIGWFVVITVGPAFVDNPQEVLSAEFAFFVSMFSFAIVMSVAAVRGKVPKWMLG